MDRRSIAAAFYAPMKLFRKDMELNAAYYGEKLTTEKVTAALSEAFIF